MSSADTFATHTPRVRLLHWRLCRFCELCFLALSLSLVGRCSASWVRITQCMSAFNTTSRAVLTLNKQVHLGWDCHYLLRCRRTFQSIWQADPRTESTCCAYRYCAGNVEEFSAESKVLDFKCDDASMLTMFTLFLDFSPSGRRRLGRLVPSKWSLLGCTGSSSLEEDRLCRNYRLELYTKLKHTRFSHRSTT